MSDPKPRSISAVSYDESEPGASLTPFLFRTNMNTNPDGGALACPACGSFYLQVDRVVEVSTGADEYEPTTVTALGAVGVDPEEVAYYRRLHGRGNRGPVTVLDMQCGVGCRPMHVLLRAHKGATFPSVVLDERSHE